MFVTLNQVADDIGGLVKVVRTLVIENDVPFAVVGKAWVFDDKAAARIAILHREHTERAEKLIQRNRHRVAIAVA